MILSAWGWVIFPLSIMANQGMGSGAGNMSGGALGLGAKISTDAIIVIDKGNISMMTLSAIWLDFFYNLMQYCKHLNIITRTQQYYMED